jgi:hypothetical protein
MPKPVNRVNANMADYIEMMNDFSLLRLEHNGDEAREILGLGSEQLKKIKYYFQVVDMRAALPVDNVHWSDEIHPSGTGFRRLAEDFWRLLLRGQFPGRGFE